MFNDFKFVANHSIYAQFHNHLKNDYEMPTIVASIEKENSL